MIFEWERKRRRRGGRRKGERERERETTQCPPFSCFLSCQYLSWASVARGQLGGSLENVVSRSKLVQCKAEQRRHGECKPAQYPC